MAAPVTAILDACVLYSAPLRDLHVELASRNVYRGRWSGHIHDEWSRNLVANRKDLDPAKISRTRELMNSRVRDSLVVDYEPLIEGLVLPDPDDRHVLAAAIRCRAELIVTKNLKDFPANILAPYRIEAKHPDDFLHGLLRGHEGSFCDAVRATHGRLKNPPMSRAGYFLTLESQGLVQTVSRLRELIDVG
jgi:predicted nucleic acid-binding protein